jgi:hypothetical protein
LYAGGIGNEIVGIRSFVDRNGVGSRGIENNGLCGSGSAGGPTPNEIPGAAAAAGCEGYALSDSNRGFVCDEEYGGLRTLIKKRVLIQNKAEAFALACGGNRQSIDIRKAF